jgi:hypothetical protein
MRRADSSAIPRQSSTRFAAQFVACRVNRGDHDVDHGLHVEALGIVFLMEPESRNRASARCRHSERMPSTSGFDKGDRSSTLLIR